ncbi:MAG: hypothetical protein FE78DRAFT_72524 [Acidomyces sp. 'richmondensis']|nr:MAG: hypothetical protein FE78DRAFT_72524 [Acidomyces sp. 'richmondensis']
MRVRTCVCESTCGRAGQISPWRESGRGTRTTYGVVSSAQVSTEAGTPQSCLLPGPSSPRLARPCLSAACTGASSIQHPASGVQRPASSSTQHVCVCTEPHCANRRRPWHRPWARQVRCGRSDNNRHVWFTTDPYCRPPRRPDTARPRSKSAVEAGHTGHVGTRNTADTKDGHAGHNGLMGHIGLTGLTGFTGHGTH